MYKEKIKEKMIELDYLLKEVMLDGDLSYKEKEQFKSNVNFAIETLNEILGDDKKGDD